MNTPSLLIGAKRPDLVINETLPDLIREAAHLYNNKTALIFGNQQLTYAELDRWSDYIAAFIAGKGIGRGHSIGVWHNRGLQLHAVILGIAKSGAAYVPLDREMPEERLQTVMQEVGAAACFSDGQPNLSCPVFTIPHFPQIDEDFEIPAGPMPDDHAYVLYTSGSTGKPKGIPISHRNICHLVRSEQSVIQIQPDDRVYQGFSVSFDMWCEETWISLHAGATIWVADAITAKTVDELGGVLRENHITVLHAVPSLLGVMDDNIPTLRLVNAGGEACTPAVLNRWSKPGKNIFYNSYGPTETTVTSTMVPLVPGDIISIGGPLPNYNLGVVDEDFNLVPMGQEGQLIISGPGVCEGYLNRPELTSQKFLPKPAKLVDLPGDKIYLSGDVVVIQPDGRIDFHGRMDDQIKLRGYRIELGEIEVKLSELSGISAAAVALKKNANGQDHLVGYVTLKTAVSFSEPEARTALAQTLPAYMIPLFMVVLDTMPRLSSGKIDRKSLPVPEALLAMELDEPLSIDPEAPIADRVMAALSHVFPNREITPDMDFFNDLGGESLLAANFITILRQQAGLERASLRDVFTIRPLVKLIKAFEETAKESNQPKKIAGLFHRIPPLRYFLCGLGQAISLLFIYSLFAIQIFIPYLGYYYVVAQTESGRQDRGIAIIVALLLYCIVPPIIFAVGIGLKWLLLGKVKEGDHPLWGWYYFKYWLVKRVLDVAPEQYMSGTPIYPLYLRLLGAKVAKDAQLSTISIGAHDLVEIGSDVTLSSGVVLDNVSVENGMISFRKIKIADHGYVGSSSVLSGGSNVLEWGELADLSHLQAEKTIGVREVWKGSPAEKSHEVPAGDLQQPLSPLKRKTKKYGLIYSVLLVVFPIVILLPLWPVIEILNYLDLSTPADYDFGYFVHIPLLTLMYIVLFALETVVVSRLLLKGIKPGIYPVYSRTYVRKWLADQLISTALVVLHPIYATVFVSFFFRLLGAKVGKNSEISTASNVTHTMLEIGDECFIADAVTLGEEDIRGQRLILNHTKIGDKSFVGNSALIPQGYELGSNMLIGVLSVPPTAAQLASTPANDWFGSPAIALPRRQSSGDFAASLTTKPSWQRRLARGIIETIRIVLPETVIICCSVLFIAYCHDLVKDRGVLQVIGQLPKLPFYYLIYMGLPAFFITLMLKWVFVGVYKTTQKPMWTHYVWRSEAITSTYEALAAPFMLDFLKGTPFLPMALRLFGVKIGKRVWMNTTDITEYDMVTIGDDAALNEDCGPQTHLFEDRIMKVGPVNIGARTSIGSRSIILYDSHIGDDVTLQPLSLVMKGEHLASGTHWGGSPVRPC
ncbi:MAG: Pls/PosA family non-ribosomal peptide synthetase [Mucilaginibacter sp.]